MKKHITLAAFLAAGAAFANAEVLLDTDFTDYADLAAAKADGWNQTTRNGRSDALKINSENGLQCPGWKQSTFEHALASGIDLDADGVYTITYDALKTGNNVAFQFALTSDNLSLVLGTSYDTNPGLYFGDAATNVLTSSSWYSFQNSADVMQIGTDKTFSDTALANNVFLTYSLKLTTSATENDTLSVAVLNGGTTIVSGEYGFAGTGTLTGAGFMLEGGGTAVSVKNVSVSSIPEPSLFGLFAGLGALCLVGTRRRRR